MLKDRQRGEKKPQRKSPQAKTKPLPTKPRQPKIPASALRWVRSLPGSAPVTFGQSKLAQPRCEAGSHASRVMKCGTCLEDRPSCPSCVSAHCQYGPGAVPSTTVSKCAQCASHKVLPHAQRAAEALLCQGQWEVVH